MYEVTGDIRDRSDMRRFADWCDRHNHVSHRATLILDETMPPHSFRLHSETIALGSEAASRFLAIAARENIPIAPRGFEADN